jgi:hypothetical protein
MLLIKVDQLERVNSIHKNISDNRLVTPNAMLIRKNLITTWNEKVTRSGLLALRNLLSTITSVPSDLYKINHIIIRL